MESVPFSSSHLRPVSKSPVVLAPGAASLAVVASPLAATLAEADMYTSLVTAANDLIINDWVVHASPAIVHVAALVVSLSEILVSLTANSIDARP